MVGAIQDSELLKFSSYTEVADGEKEHESG